MLVVALERDQLGGPPPRIFIGPEPAWLVLSQP